jgi:hypothetical protein
MRLFPIRKKCAEDIRNLRKKRDKIRQLNVQIIKGDLGCAGGKKRGFNFPVMVRALPGRSAFECKLNAKELLIEREKLAQFGVPFVCFSEAVQNLLIRFTYLHNGGSSYPGLFQRSAA